MLALSAVAAGRHVVVPSPDAPTVFYDPWPIDYGDRRNVRGGRWRAVARWRTWERQRRGPATRRTRFIRI